MFWNLLLAHFLADYPLQTNWMVRHKPRPIILVMHVGIHLAVMLLAAYPASRRAWPVLVVLTVVHYFLDMGKINLGKILPRQVVLPYLIDQTIHYATLLVAAWLIGRLAPAQPPTLLLPPLVAILGVAFVFVTHVWYISERVIKYADPEYVQAVVAQAKGRMLARAGLLGGLWAAAAWIIQLTGFHLPVVQPLPGVAAALAWAALAWGAVLAGAAVLVLVETRSGWLPYREPAYRRRAVLTDLAVVIAVFALSLMAFLSL